MNQVLFQSTATEIMNINLTGAKKQNKGKNLSFGLNKRKKPVANVFDDGDSDDSSEEDAPQDTAKSRRDAVNREIEAEQKALRDRAKKVMTDSGKGTLYDYDAAYDSMQTKKDQKDEQMAASKEKRSRYIQDLLKTSEKRAVEREAIYERKVAREQEEEDAQADYRGKEKFVTKGRYIFNFVMPIVISTVLFGTGSWFSDPCDRPHTIFVSAVYFSHLFFQLTSAS